MPRFRKSGVDLQSDRCRKNLDVLGKLSDRIFGEKKLDAGDRALTYHLMLCRLCPLVPISTFQEAVDQVMKEKFPPQEEGGQ